MKKKNSSVMNAKKQSYLKDNKSPGIDGIPNEFYKTFWNEIKNILYSCLLYTFETGKMSLTQRL